MNFPFIGVTSRVYPELDSLCSKSHLIKSYQPHPLICLMRNLAASVCIGPTNNEVAANQHTDCKQIFFTNLLFFIITMFPNCVTVRQGS